MWLNSNLCLANSIMSRLWSAVSNRESRTRFLQHSVLSAREVSSHGRTSGLSEKMWKDLEWGHSSAIVRQFPLLRRCLSFFSIFLLCSSIWSTHGFWTPGCPNPVQKPSQSGQNPDTVDLIGDGRSHEASWVSSVEIQHGKREKPVVDVSGTVGNLVRTSGEIQ